MFTIKDAKKIMPSGARITKVGASWDKRGGYAGERSIEATKEKAFKFGFQPFKAGQFNTPDGSVVSNECALAHPDGWILNYSWSYGCYKADNWYSLTLRQIETL
jgi:hypothetical protein